MIRYCLGFAFCGDHVVLVRKARPDWQAGRLNGVGGKVEPGENERDAMAREFREEACLVVGADRWRLVSVMGGEHRESAETWECAVFAAVLDRRELGLVRTGVDDEPIQIVDRGDIATGNVKIVPNLAWLVPLACDPEAPLFVNAEY